MLKGIIVFGDELPKRFRGEGEAGESGAVGEQERGGNL
jgi:hypothetical protein